LRSSAYCAPQTSVGDAAVTLVAQLSGELAAALTYAVLYSALFDRKMFGRFPPLMIGALDVIPLEASRIIT
jgi:hypothetical protein